MSDVDSNSHTRLEIGRTLERARRERGLSLEDVEQTTKIRARYLRDLENENFDVLPTVYILGSLKTYAGYLGLDGEALARELKHRQAQVGSQNHEEPQAGEPQGLLASLSRLLGVQNTEKDENDSGAVPDHSPRLYMSLGVVLIFVLAIALASTLRAEDQPSVSQVHETRISKFPSMLALVGAVKDDERQTGAEENQQERSPAEDAGRDEKDKSDRTEQDEDAPQTAASSASASASASASTASASASAAPESKTQASVRPEREVAEAPEDVGGDDAASESGGAGMPNPRGGDGVAVRKSGEDPFGTAWVGKKISNKVKIAFQAAQ